MRFRLDYNTSRLLKENLPFLLGLTALCTISLFTIYYNLQQYNNNKTKIETIGNEIKEYNKKKSLLDFKNQVVDNEVNLDLANQTLSQLIPVSEDYFSILVALEKLSVKTGFIITSYNIVVNNSTPNRLAIVIEGKGDPNAFLEFLKEYNFAGGRLITIDKIDFNQFDFNGTKVNINVYTGKVAAQTNPAETTNDVDMELLRTILSKVEINLKPENPVVEDYPTKLNPF